MFQWLVKYDETSPSLGRSPWWAPPASPGELLMGDISTGKTHREMVVQWDSMGFYGIYLLVKIYIPTERSTILSGNTYDFGPFSTAMLNYWRVSSFVLKSCGFSTCFFFYVHEKHHGISLWISWVLCVPHLLTNRSLEPFRNLWRDTFWTDTTTRPLMKFQDLYSKW